jgi:hypothetical protein
MANKRKLCLAFILFLTIQVAVPPVNTYALTVDNSVSSATKNSTQTYGGG